jgi:hypothetical protein
VQILGAIQPNALLDREQLELPLHEGINSGDDFFDGTAQTTQLAYDQDVPWSSVCQQEIHLAFLDGAPGRDANLEELIHREPFAPGKLQNGQALVGHILGILRDSRVGQCQYRSLGVEENVSAG